MTRAIVAHLPLGLWAAAVLLVGSAEVGTPGGLPRGADKVAHFLMYAVGGALAAWMGRKSRNPWEGWTGLAIVVGTGLVDEIHQIRLPYRDSDVFDWLADVAGAVVGFTAVRLILKKKG